MLRTLVVVLMMAAPSAAFAEQFPESPLGQEVYAHDGTALGRVEAVERDAEGRIIAVEIPGLEPGDAPTDLVAENERERGPRIPDAERRRERGASSLVRAR